MVSKTSQRGIDDLILSEGLRISAYKDSVGVWTIGVGHTSAEGPPEVTPALRVTRDEAIAILKSDLVKCERRVVAALGPDLPQHVFDGAVSFDFNTGSILKASWVPLYKAGNMAEARKHFMFWNRPPEIVPRRTREAQLIFEGKYATGTQVPEAPPAPKPSATSAGAAGSVAVGTAAAAAAAQQGLSWGWVAVVGVAVAVVVAIVILAGRKR